MQMGPQRKRTDPDSQPPERFTRLLSKIADDVAKERSEPQPASNDDELRHQLALSKSRRLHLEAFIAERGKHYAGCTLENFSCISSDSNERKEQANIRSQLTNVDLQGFADSPVNMVFFGPVGTGKDHLMVAMVKRLLAMATYRDRIGRTRAPTVRWTAGASLFSDARDRMETKQTEKDFIAKWTAPDLLCISDPIPVGQSLTPYQSELLYQIVDARYNREQPIWITVNAKHRAQLDERLGPAVADRFIANALTFYCNWESARKARKA